MHACSSPAGDLAPVDASAYCSIIGRDEILCCGFGVGHLLPRVLFPDTIVMLGRSSALCHLPGEPEGQFQLLHSGDASWFPSLLESCTAHVR